MAQKIVIVDYQAGNIGSIQNMLARIGVKAIISNQPSEIETADKLILPGVGSFDYGVSKLKESNLLDILNEKVLQSKTPILGICLGAQLMCLGSEEGKLKGFGWIDADVTRFTNQHGEKKFSVPHMGWDNVMPVKESRLASKWEVEARFYFVHSYYINCKSSADVLFENKYGASFHSGFERDNILGVQFHPEKSHRFGKQLLSNFISCY